MGTLFNSRNSGRPKTNIYAVGEPINQRVSRYHRALLDFCCSEVQPGVSRRQVLEDAIDNHVLPKILAATDYNEEMLREMLHGAIRQRLRELGELDDTSEPGARPHSPAEPEPEPAPSKPKVAFANVEQALN
jgi:hypothetical protein